MELPSTSELFHSPFINPDSLLTDGSGWKNFGK
jgi:hypothetical protein